MRTALLSTIVLCFSFFKTFSQTVHDKGSFTFTLGPTIPLGDYADKNLNSASSGLAKTGVKLAVSYDRFLNNQYGVLLTAYGQTNPLDIEKLENALSNNAFRVWKIENKSWLLVGLLVGGLRQFPLTASSISITLKGMVGAVFAKSPELNGASSTDSSSATVVQTSASSFGFNYIINSSFNYRLNDKIFLVSSFEYAGTNKITFKDIKSTISSVVHYSNGNMVVQQNSVTADGKQSFASFNFLLGVVIRL